LVLYQTDCGALPGISAARVLGVKKSLGILHVLSTSDSLHGSRLFVGCPVSAVIIPPFLLLLEEGE
jgi:hypothetical protein